MRRQRIPGEYARVSSWTTQYANLDIAHANGCTQLEAIKLVIVLGGQFTDKLPEVVFRRKRGWAHLRRNMISLPAETYDSSIHFCREGHLRIGLVIHELAHIIAWQKAKATGHCPLFVSWLDILIERWWSDGAVCYQVPKLLSVAEEAQLSRKGEELRVAGRSHSHS